MSAKQKLDYDMIWSFLITDIEGIQHLNETLTKLYKNYFDSETTKLKVEPIKPPSDYDNVMKVVKIMTDPKKDETEIESIMNTLSKPTLLAFKKILVMFNNKNQTELFLKNMCITYLIISFENFLTKILHLSFLSNPNMLKTDSKISFEDIINLEDYDSILSEMIEKKQDQLLNRMLMI